MTDSRRTASLTNMAARPTGFSLLELLVAMGIFLVIVGAAVTLFRRHVPLFAAQQNQTGINIALRNSAAQMQLDLVNAGTGYYPGINMASWPVGITIQNPGNGSVCFTAGANTYGPGCFDTLNVISVDQAALPAHPSDSTGACVSTGATTLYATPVGGTAAQLAATLHNNDDILLIKGNGSTITHVKLTGDASVSGAMVLIPHTATVTYTDPSTGTAYTGINNNDNLFIATPATKERLDGQYCNTDWVLKLAPIQYRVDATNPANPLLTRQQGNGQAQVIADQVIGFKVGAWNTVTGDYAYNDTSVFGSDWNTIRAVRVSLIGRTNPATGAASEFRNTFDNGRYKVEGVSIVVNPRNLSMND